MENNSGLHGLFQVENMNRCQGLIENGVLFITSLQLFTTSSKRQN